MKNMIEKIDIYNEYDRKITRINKNYEKQEQISH